MIYYLSKELKDNKSQTVMETTLKIEELNILFGLGFKRVDSNAHGKVVGKYWYNGVFFVTVERSGMGATSVNVFSGKGKQLLILNSVDELLNYNL